MTGKCKFTTAPQSKTVYCGHNWLRSIFDFIENGKKADKLDVVYYENLGYPKQVIYDGRVDVADDELQLQIKNLEVVYKFENEM